MTLKKPTIYLDTNIVSALHDDGTEIGTLSRRMVTREWWDAEHAHFSVWASSFPSQIRTPLTTMAMASSAVGCARVHPASAPQPPDPWLCHLLRPAVTMTSVFRPTPNCDVDQSRWN